MGRVIGYWLYVLISANLIINLNIAAIAGKDILMLEMTVTALFIILGSAAAYFISKKRRLGWVFSLGYFALALINVAYLVFAASGQLLFILGTICLAGFVLAIDSIHEGEVLAGTIDFSWLGSIYAAKPAASKAIHISVDAGNAKGVAAFPDAYYPAEVMQQPAAEADIGKMHFQEISQTEEPRGIEDADFAGFDESVVYYNDLEEDAMIHAATVHKEQDKNMTKAGRESDSERIEKTRDNKEENAILAARKHIESFSEEKEGTMPRWPIEGTFSEVISLADNTPGLIRIEDNIREHMTQVIKMPEQRDAEFIASMNTGRFHHRDCRWAQIDTQDALHFETTEEAMTGGFTPCQCVRRAR